MQTRRRISELGACVGARETKDCHATTTLAIILFSKNGFALGAARPAGVMK